MPNNTIHPKWISCFPGGVHRWDDGTPDPEEPEIIDLGDDGYLIRIEEPVAKTLDQILTEMGF